MVTRRKKLDIKQISIFWGIGMIIAGLISIIFSRIFDLSMGIFILLLGVTAIVFRKKWVLAAIGISIILIGAINIMIMLLYQISPIFSVLGIIEILLGAGALRQYHKYN